MKTGNVSQDVLFFTQAKRARDAKAAEKKEAARQIEEKVDLSTKGSFAAPTPITSQEEAIATLSRIDFQQMKDAQWISQSGTAQLMELLST